MKILVTGGAGYIGSFMTKVLLDRGDEVIVFDNLERGHRSAVDPRASLIQGDLTDKEAVSKLFASEKIDAILHFAGLISVGESQMNPDLYRKNNILGSENLFKSAAEYNNGTKIIFSSTAAVYGNPVTVPIPEDHQKKPTSVYGETKLSVEEILNSMGKDNKSLSFACLRYFNAAGAALDGSLGENHAPETHIIPLAIKSLIEDHEFRLFGTDYNTKDGTCVRDYIHVLDLVEAHVLALKKIMADPGGYFYNV
jgi:UDP-glucose 4-epimerase